MTGIKLPSSFRDPSGFVFIRERTLFRQLNQIYRAHYELLMHSGLYKNLTESGLLISHEEIENHFVEPKQGYKIIRPETVPFISYPYEWSFSQLQDAALHTLKVQKKALESGMSLKDCSAYNIQFYQGKPIFIDTLSFEKYIEGEPWIAYRQFCGHFLAPLALMALRDIRLGQLFRVYPEGIPLDLASGLLPWKSRFRFSLLMHIHLHAKSQKRFEHKTVPLTKHRINRLGILGLIDSLENGIRNLRWNPRGTEWANYYEFSNYSQGALEQKKRLLTQWLAKLRPKSVWDLGANNGFFSRAASDQGIPTIAFDKDEAAVEKNYLECRNRKETNLLPLVLDLANPSEGIGWMNEERTSFIGRGPADAVLALALLHHLAISHNLPFSKIAEGFKKIGASLIIEFIPKNDLQAQRLLNSRKDIFTDYTQPGFENAFETYFVTEQTSPIGDSGRVLYLMRNKGI